MGVGRDGVLGASLAHFEQLQAPLVRVRARVRVGVGLGLG